MPLPYGGKSSAACTSVRTPIKHGIDKTSGKSPRAPGTWTSSGLPRPPRPAGRSPTWESRSQQRRGRDGEPLIRKQPLELSLTEALAKSATAAAMAAAIPPQPPEAAARVALNTAHERPRQLSLCLGLSRPSSRAWAARVGHQIRTFEPCHAPRDALMQPHAKRLQTCFALAEPKRSPSLRQHDYVGATLGPCTGSS